MTSPFLPEMLRVIGVQERITFWAGFLTSITFLAYAIMLPVWGSLADHHGKRLMLFRSALGIAVSYFAMVFSDSLMGLLGARLLNGFISGYTPASIILVTACTPNHQVGYALGTLNMSVAVGSILGPLVGGTLTEFIGVRNAILSAGFLMIGVALVSYYGTEEKSVESAEKTSFKQNLLYVIKTPGLLIPTLCLLILNMSVFMLQPILPLFITQMKINNAQFMVGLVFSISAVSLAIASPIINLLHNLRRFKLSYIMILIGSMLIGAVVTMTQGLADSVAFLISQRFLFGFFQAGITVSANVIIAFNAQEDMRGRVFGIVTAISALGYIVGPFAGGLIGEHGGVRVAFFTAAMLFFIMAVFLISWIRRHPELEANS
jgi:DHA1 family multidrug resistance protein-like MFS transporter